MSTSINFKDSNLSATNFNNVSVAVNATKIQIYQVPTGKVTTALSITVAPLVASMKLFLTKTRTDGKEITLIPGKAIASGDTYVAPLQEIVLLSQEKLNCQALPFQKIRATGLFGLPVIFDPLQQAIPEVAHLNVSVIER